MCDRSNPNHSSHRDNSLNSNIEFALNGQNIGRRRNLNNLSPEEMETM